MMIHCWYHEYWDRYHCRIFYYYKLEYFTEFYLFQTMLQIYVTLWESWFVCVCVSVYLVLWSHFLPFKIHLTNISPISIKMVDFKNLAWATSFATRASRKFIYLPFRASGEKKVIVIPWRCRAYCRSRCCVHVVQFSSASRWHTV